MKLRTRYTVVILVIIAVFMIWPLVHISGLVTAAPTFTGDAPADFVGLNVIKVDDPSFGVGLPDVGLPIQFPDDRVSGWDMNAAYFEYDDEADTMYVGIDCFEICGDADGDGDPGTTGPILEGLQGRDVADFSGTESFAVLIDTDSDCETDPNFAIDAAIGVPLGTDISAVGAYEFVGSPASPSTGFGSVLSNPVTVFASPSANAPDLELSIGNFSTLPGFDFTPGEAFNFQITVFMGSLEDDGIGEDFLPGALECIPVIPPLSTPTPTNTSTTIPTDTPTITPTIVLTDTPTTIPTITPTTVLTDTPTTVPTITPTTVPTDTPTTVPTDTPTITPTIVLTDTPTTVPTITPTTVPTDTPTTVPTDTPTPTDTATTIPTDTPTIVPTDTLTPTPTDTATTVPTDTPTITPPPTISPSPTTPPPPTMLPPTGPNAIELNHIALTSARDVVPYHGQAPSWIEIESIGVASNILPMSWYYTTDQSGEQVAQWDVVDYAVGWHVNSAEVGTPGNVVMSGHNTIGGSVFQNLSSLKHGDVVTVWNADQVKYTYTVDQVRVVPEKEAHIAQQEANAKWLTDFGDERLTLVSCWPDYSSSFRIIVVAHRDTR